MGAENTLYLAVGTVNRPTPYFASADGKGIVIFSFNEETLAVNEITASNSVDNPTFLSVSPEDGMIYANSEVFEWPEGTVSAYRFDPVLNELVYINKQSSKGSIAAHNMIAVDRQHLMLANYAMGSEGPDQSIAAFPIRADGSLAPASSTVAHHGASVVDPARQDRSHAHSIVQTTDGEAFLVADLGLDKVFVYTLADDGALRFMSSVDMIPGSGPRHIAQHPGGRFVFVSNELNSTVSMLRRDGLALELASSWPTIPDGVASHGADIHISADGRFVYVSNRGHDSIAIFEVDQEIGALQSRGFVPAGGKTPRNFALTPSGRHVLVANQDSNSIVIFVRDAASGALTPTGKTIEVGTPVCIKPFTM